MYKSIRKLLAIAISATFMVGGAAANSHQPYAGQQGRQIKAMSPDEVQGHLDGKGLGYAKAAELNHYPGPLHLRQLAEKINLTAEQKRQIENLEADMKARARQLGRDIIEREQVLDEMFASGRAKANAVRMATMAIGSLKGELRAVHLNTHLLVRPLLSDSQVASYDALRGYGGSMKGHNMEGMKHGDRKH